jgi:photosystem II stability/assembly factor-like uncharacterized protein
MGVKSENLEDLLRTLGKKSDWTPDDKTRLQRRLQQAMQDVPPYRQTKRRKTAAKRSLMGAAAAAVAVCVAAGVYEYVQSASLQEPTPAVQEHQVDVQAAPPFHSFNGVFMVDSKHGWILTPDHRILRTIDGGKTWVNVTSELNQMDTRIDPGAHSQSKENSDTAVQLVATGASTAVATMGFHPSRVYWTDDGGNTWHASSIHLSSSELAVSLSFSDSLHGWLTTAVWYHDETAPASLYRTTDGGKSWEKVALLLQQQGKYVLYYPITFKDAQNGFALGAALKPGAHAAETMDLGQYDWSKVYLFRTMDGGIHWERTSTAFREVNGPAVNAPIQFAGNFAYVMIGNTLYTSNDGGTTWKDDVMPQNGLVQFVDNQHGWIWMGNDTMKYTPDGGKTWIGDVRLQYVSSLEFLSQRIGWASTSTEVLSTTDGGKTWQVVYRY